MKKIAIVTGAGGGIGFASVKKLLERGFFVYGTGVKSAERAEEVFSGLSDFRYMQCSLDDSAARERVVSTIIKEHGRIDVLVNVAGIAPKVRRDLLEMTEESYDYVMGINTKGTLFLTQLVAQQMVKQEKTGGVRGYIINISSCSAYTSSISRGEYCISKAGVSMITKLFADRLASEAIPVNEICPGVIHTPMTSTVQEKYDRLIEQGLIPLERWGEPEDIAKVVDVLCSGAFDYTTGESIIVDGGMHIRKL